MTRVRFRDEITLIEVGRTQGENGYPVEMERRREVFADVQSVKRGEFYKSLQAGLELSAAFLLRACDYGGQVRVDYDGKRYKVERAYTKDGELVELNCSEYKGV